MRSGVRLPLLEVELGLLGKRQEPPQYTVDKDPPSSDAAALDRTARLPIAFGLVACGGFGKAALF